MTRTTALAPLLALSLLLVACGDDEPESGPPESPAATETSVGTAAETSAETSAATAVETEPSEATTSAAAAPGDDLPTYEEVRAIYLETADDASKASCAESSEDASVGAPAAGESYLRLVCGGITRFDYVLGAEGYADNYASMVAGTAYKAVFHVPGRMVVDPSGSDEDLAPAIQAACGCGEVVDVVLE